MKKIKEFLLKRWMEKTVWEIESLKRTIRGREEMLNEKERVVSKLEMELKERERENAVLLESRLNLEREVEILRGQMEMMKDIQEREIMSMKGMVDWFGLECRGREVYGVAPQPKIREGAKEDEGLGRMAGKALRSQAAQQFMSELHALAQRKSEMEKNGE